MIAQALTDSISAVMKQRLRDSRQRDLLVARVMLGFSALGKLPVPDLDKRLKTMETRVRQLAENAQLEFKNGRPVVKVNGSSESLLKELRYGTDWYMPWPEVDETMLVAVLLDPSE